MNEQEVVVGNALTRIKETLVETRVHSEVGERVERLTRVGVRCFYPRISEPAFRRANTRRETTRYQP